MGTGDHIAVDAGVCGGKPVIRGTRILVRNVLGILAGPGTVQDVLDAYPELTEEQVRSAIEYAARVVDEEKVVAAD